MVDYSIVKIGKHSLMVNGEMARWDDYDYCDDDHHRQDAMNAATNLDKWGARYWGPLGEKPVDGVVVLNLKRPFFGHVNEPMTEREILEAKLDIFRMEDQLDQPGDFL